MPIIPIVISKKNQGKARLLIRCWSLGQRMKYAEIFKKKLLLIQIKFFFASPGYDGSEIKIKT